MLLGYRLILEGGNSIFYVNESFGGLNLFTVFILTTTSRPSCSGQTPRLCCTGRRHESWQEFWVKTVGRWLGKSLIDVKAAHGKICYQLYFWVCLGSRWRGRSSTEGPWFSELPDGYPLTFRLINQIIFETMCQYVLQRSNFDSSYTILQQIRLWRKLEE